MSRVVGKTTQAIVRASSYERCCPGQRRTLWHRCEFVVPLHLTETTACPLRLTDFPTRARPGFLSRRKRKPLERFSCCHQMFFGGSSPPLRDITVPGTGCLAFPQFRLCFCISSTNVHFVLFTKDNSFCHAGRSAYIVVDAATLARTQAFKVFTCI